jgi:hypothetical protein
MKNSRHQVKAVKFALAGVALCGLAFRPAVAAAQCAEMAAMSEAPTVEAFYMGPTSVQISLDEVNGEGSWSYGGELGTGASCGSLTSKSNLLLFVNASGVPSKFTSVDSGGTIIWSGPTALSGSLPNHCNATDWAPPGAPIAMTYANGTNYAFLVDSCGILERFTGSGGSWGAPTALTGQSFARAGAPLAAAVQGGSQVDAFVIDNHGTLDVQVGTSTYPIAGGFPTGGGVAATLQGGTSSQLDVLAANDLGELELYAVVGFGSFANFPLWGGVPAGVPLSAAAYGSQTWVSYADGSRTLWLGNVVGTGSWTRKAISGSGFAVGGAVPAFTVQGSTMDMVVMGTSGPSVFALTGGTNFLGPWPLPDGPGA